MNAKQINRLHHSSDFSYESFQRKVKYAQEKIKSGEAEIGTDTYKGRKLQSVFFPKENYGFHLPLNILKL
jgi:hypothetical protein